MMMTMTTIQMMMMVNMTMVNDYNYDDYFVACSTFTVIPRAHMPSPFTPFHRARSLCNASYPPPALALSFACSRCTLAP